MNAFRHRILISAPLDFLPDLKKKISNETSAVFSYGADCRQVKSLLKENPFDAWLVSPCPTYKIDSKLLDLCPTIKIIATPSTGSNHLDIHYLRDRGIELFTLRETNIVNQIYASSEFTFLLMLSVIRKIPYSFLAVLEGKWREIESRFRGRELNGLTIGIVGYGRIGRNLARYSHAFGMNILVHDPYVKAENSYIRQFESIDEMLSIADVIVVCVHLNNETYKMMNDDAFSKMKTGVYFINTSRGDVVDEDAFIKYLVNSKIRAAGVDVLSDELTGDKNAHPLVKYARMHDNLIITPHIAGLTYDSEKKAQTAAYHAIFNFLNKRG